MPIIVIDGPPKQAYELAQTLRGAQISRGRGALLVLMPKGAEHAVVHQIEKILDGVKFPAEPPKDLALMKWKDSPLVVVPAANEKALPDFEAALPGFTKYFGPVSRMSAA